MTNLMKEFQWKWKWKAITQHNMTDRFAQESRKGLMSQRIMCIGRGQYLKGIVNFRCSYLIEHSSQTPQIGIARVVSGKSLVCPMSMLFHHFPQIIGYLRITLMSVIQQLLTSEHTNELFISFLAKNTGCHLYYYQCSTSKKDTLGRQKMKRKRNVLDPAPNKLRKTPRMTCFICRQHGHNMNGCPIRQASPS